MGDVRRKQCLNVTNILPVSLFSFLAIPDLPHFLSPSFPHIISSFLLRSLQTLLEPKPPCKPSPPSRECPGAIPMGAGSAGPRPAGGLACHRGGSQAERMRRRPCLAGCSQGASLPGGCSCRKSSTGCHLGPCGEGQGLRNPCWSCSTGESWLVLGGVSREGSLALSCMVKLDGLGLCLDSWGQPVSLSSAPTLPPVSPEATWGLQPSHPGHGLPPDVLG